MRIRSQPSRAASCAARSLPSCRCSSPRPSSSSSPPPRRHYRADGAAAHAAAGRHGAALSARAPVGRPWPSRPDHRRPLDRLGGDGACEVGRRPRQPHVAATSRAIDRFGAVNLAVRFLVWVASGLTLRAAEAVPVTISRLAVWQSGNLPNPAPVLVPRGKGEAFCLSFRHSRNWPSEAVADAALSFNASSR